MSDPMMEERLAVQLQTEENHTTQETECSSAVVQTNRTNSHSSTPYKYASQ